ncbi:ATP-binding protein [Collimonas silvisoli]|uniref:ATP-binding protein n=1 Tax=Collimonas silvisoli TaxID=2825884 RepID=UPI001B8C6BCE|nr:ATP-binding protein [Collimonas silvisoli]
MTNFYRQINIGSKGAISLVGDDGTIKVRKADGESDASFANGLDISGEPSFGVMKARRQGYLIAQSPVDGRLRAYAYRHMEKYPLYVIVGIAIDEAMQPFYSNRYRASMLAGIAIMMVCAFTIFILFLANQLLSTRRTATLANQAKSQFLANMSHELRTPLTGILGYAELLRDDLYGTDKWDFAQAIHDSGTHLLLLVNTVLDTERIAAGKMEVTIATENLRDLMHQIVAGHASTAIRKKIALRLMLNPMLPHEFACDRSKVVTVLNNLIHNALKFTHQGRVTIWVLAANQMLIFKVMDTGEGIPAELQNAVFEKFFQVGGPERQAQTGSGLGLALVKDLVSFMGGTIAIRSRPGRGSIFTFTLPI